MPISELEIVRSQGDEVVPVLFDIIGHGLVIAALIRLVINEANRISGFPGVVPDVKWIGHSMRSLTNLASCWVSFLMGHVATGAPDVEHGQGNGRFRAPGAAGNSGKDVIGDHAGATPGHRTSSLSSGDKGWACSCHLT